MLAGALRERGGAETPAVTTMELFFDLVYVFAITRLSGYLFDQTSAASAWIILAGPALYLAGNSLFKYTLSRRAPVSRLVAIAVLAPLAAVVDPLALSMAAVVVTVTLAVMLGRASAPTHS